MKREQRRKHNFSMGSNTNQGAPTNTNNLFAPKEGGYRFDEEYQDQMKKKKVLQLEMELIKKRITENCTKMNLYEHIKEVGKIVHSSEKFGKSTMTILVTYK